MANLEICHLTDAGGRSTNEDRVLVLSIDKLYLLAVADGLGGRAAGEVASSVALKEIEEFLKANVAGGDRCTTLEEAIARANKEVYLLSRENPAYAGMGTTLVLALVQQDKILIANVGDSRAYHLSGNRLIQITTDHSVVQELMERGVITEDEVRRHPQRSKLTRAIGVEQQVKADLHETELMPGDTMLLCSDGLTDPLTDEGIKAVINSSSKLDEACAELVREAKEKGSTDNISVILGRRKPE